MEDIGGFSFGWFGAYFLFLLVFLLVFCLPPFFVSIIFIAVPYAATIKIPEPFGEDI